MGVNFTGVPRNKSRDYNHFKLGDIETRSGDPFIDYNALEEFRKEGQKFKTRILLENGGRIDKTVSSSEKHIIDKNGTRIIKKKMKKIRPPSDYP